MTTPLILVSIEAFGIHNLRGGKEHGEKEKEEQGHEPPPPKKKIPDIIYLPKEV